MQQHALEMQPRPVSMSRALDEAATAQPLRHLSDEGVVMNGEAAAAWVVRDIDLDQISNIIM